ncbi:uncharacterized protein BDW43DRAFT_295549, partial [Aspergillus alliaceus]|uniref:uncharacterized protein n=1 Tax=Petromyces alliaceus TaxID=209559 RepID=UPI0012A6B126
MVLALLLVISINFLKMKTSTFHELLTMLFPAGLRNTSPLGPLLIAEFPATSGLLFWPSPFLVIDHGCCGAGYFSHEIQEKNFFSKKKI